MAGKFTHKINIMKKGLALKYDDKFSLDVSEFWSVQQKRFITQFKLNHIEYDPVTDRERKVEVLRTSSQIDVVKYLADVFKAHQRVDAEDNYEQTVNDS